jgi:His/Glu/Gln/Arg/opine family amino acid ABC transporter permease subunit
VREVPVRNFKPVIQLVLFLVFFALINVSVPGSLTNAWSSQPAETELVVAERLQNAADSLTIFNYTNRQTMTSTRLRQLISDIALPVAYDGIAIVWSVDNPYLEIGVTTESFTVRDLTGQDVTFDVLVASIVGRPNVFQGNSAFSITASLSEGGETIVRTFTGAIVPLMPADFWGGVVYTVVRNAMLFFEGVVMTLGLSLGGTILGFILALALVSMRLQAPTQRDNKPIKLLKRFVSGFAKLYVTVFRGTPMIVQAAFFWYGLHLFNNPVLCGLFVVSVNTAAYIAEILRGSILAIDKGQLEAARTIGMTNAQAMRYVILPQAVKNAMPAIGNEFVINIKDTAVLSVIEIYELFYQTKRIVGNNYRQLEAYLVVAAIYLFLTYTVTKLLARIERKFDMPVVDLPSSN